MSLVKILYIYRLNFLDSYIRMKFIIYNDSGDLSRARKRLNPSREMQYTKEVLCANLFATINWHHNGLRLYILSDIYSLYPEFISRGIYRMIDRRTRSIGVMSAHYNHFF